jgi:hypothetical protein
MGVIEIGRMYSRNHCLTRMPMNAEDRAATRLTNQRELINMADKGAENGTTLAARVRGASSPLIWTLPPSFAEISVSNLMAVSCGSCESHW